MLFTCFGFFVYIFSFCLELIQYIAFQFYFHVVYTIQLMAHCHRHRRKSMKIHRNDIGYIAAIKHKHRNSVYYFHMRELSSFVLYESIQLT